MEIILLEAAITELEEAIEYYEDQLPGLGKNFQDEVMHSFDIISNHPISWTKVGPNTRRSLIKRFPYFILYVADKTTITVTAIGHQHRNPDYYSDRIS